MYDNVNYSSGSRYLSIKMLLVVCTIKVVVKLLVGKSAMPDLKNGDGE